MICFNNSGFNKPCVSFSFIVSIIMLYNGGCPPYPNVSIHNQIILPSGCFVSRNRWMINAATDLCVISLVVIIIMLNRVKIVSWDMNSGSKFVATNGVISSLEYNNSFLQIKAWSHD